MSESDFRTVLGVIPGVDAQDGAGVKLKRSLGGPRLQHFDPFLLLDEFRSDQAGDYIAGFPDHPHRGFETVTYMLAGRMRHRDNQGNSGLLQSGGAQWMTAGRGIVHSEMPEQEDGLMWGFQLWVNLPAADKMTAPRYQDIEPGDIPEAERPGGARVRIVAGELGGVAGPVSGIATKPLYYDVALPAEGRFDEAVPEGHNAFVYVYGGGLDLGSHTLSEGQMALLTDGARVEARARGGEARFLLIAGQPIGEPVARYGPFVMNTKEEIIQAFRDYEAGKF
ncbi:pirin family protein [Minwuia thermotolerans]|uniref:Quercetin 2,3-dioxygenase n=1 Tax=Minwuia thermotolerans TaxID=2056226 RepID=A0A2M9G7B3_9PROT|nr:pirin family protein [Minwuia thermotolerans]PJK31591.1 quercetin 2,3-dioxygenase [Minwuia thermotolerans]